MTIQSENNQSNQFCVFRCQTEVLALSANHVRSVTPQPEITPVPFADCALAGMAHVQKEFIPVFDVGQLLNSHEQQPNGLRQLLFISLDDCDFGLLVDQVMGLDSLEISYSGTLEGSRDWPSVISGSATYRDQFVSVIESISLAHLLNDRLHGQWQNAEQMVATEEK